MLPGILLILCAVILFSLSDVLAKLLRPSSPASEIAWMRYVAFAGTPVQRGAQSRPHHVRLPARLVAPGS